MFTNSIYYFFIDIKPTVSKPKIKLNTFIILLVITIQKFIYYNILPTKV